MVTFDDVIAYPKFYADGGVEIAKGLFTNMDGLKEIDEAILKEINDEFHFN